MKENKRVSSFATRLKELRQEKDISQRKLAEEVGIESTLISAWERKKYTPNLECVVKLAEYFEVTVGYMAGFEE